MQRVRIFRKEPANIAGGLPDTVLILDKRYAHEPFPVLTETDARRNGDIRLFDQQLRKPN